MTKFYAAKEYHGDVTDTEIGRVRLKLSRLMAKEMSGNPAFRRMWLKESIPYYGLNY